MADHKLLILCPPPLFFGVLYLKKSTKSRKTGGGWIVLKELFNQLHSQNFDQLLF
jgi:hypothetical protein